MCDGPTHPPEPSCAAEGVSRLLEASAGGDPRAAQRLFEVLYDQLHALAQNHMRAERGDHTLQPTALVHEAYLRLVQIENIQWQGKAHFYVAAADAMRRVLVDHARKSGAAKRGGGWNDVTLNLNDLASGRAMGELLAINDAIEQLAARDPQAARVVHLRFFAGLNVDETAKVLGISPRSVDRDWQYARVWLKKELTADDEGQANGGGR